MKSNVKSHLADKWWMYLAVALLLIIIWEWIFNFVDELQPNEKVTVTVSSYGVGALPDKLAEICPKPEYLREIELNSYGVGGTGGYDDYTLQSQLQVLAFEEQSDLIILPQSLIDSMENFVRGYCAELSQEYLQSTFGDSLTEKFGSNATLQFEDSDKVWGIKIYDGATDTGFARDYIAYDNGDDKQDYYLIFSVNSVHTSSLNGDVSVDDYAIDLAKALLQL